MPEARLEDSGAGLAPASDGWFVLNARDAVWLTWEARGSLCSFESPESSFPQLGFGLHLLEPGQPTGLYQAESEQEPLPLGRWARPSFWSHLPLADRPAP